MSRIYRPPRTPASSSSSSSSIASVGSKEGLLAPPPYSSVERGLPYCSKPPRRRRVRNCLAYAALAVSLLCLGCTVLMGFIGYCRLNKMTKAVKEVQATGEVCIPCAHVQPNPLSSPSSSSLLEELDVHSGDDDNDTEICCAKTPTQYAALFKLILRRQEEVKRFADITGTASKLTSSNGDIQGDVTAAATSSVSAHLVFKPSTTYSDDADKTIQRWKSGSESPLSHVRPGLTLDDDVGSSIYITTPGLYFVYCQILFSADTVSTSPEIASTYVERHSVTLPASSGILLKSRHTRHDVSSDRHSSYVAGLFFLHKGDQLYVRVSSPEVVSHDDGASFFGMFRVGD